MQPAKLTVEGLAVGLVDQCAKLGLAPGEEVWGTHDFVPQLSADVPATDRTRVSWGGSRRTRLVPAWP
jgi:hypothetical protein